MFFHDILLICQLSGDETKFLKLQRQVKRYLDTGSQNPVFHLISLFYLNLYNYSRVALITENFFWLWSWIWQFRCILASHCLVWVWLSLKHFFELHLRSQRLQPVRPAEQARLRWRGQIDAEPCWCLCVHVWVQQVCTCSNQLLTFAICCCPGNAWATAKPAWHPFIEVLLLSSHSAPLICLLPWGQLPPESCGGLGFFEQYVAVSVSLRLCAAVQLNTSSCLFRYITVL